MIVTPIVTTILTTIVTTTVGALFGVVLGNVLFWPKVRRERIPSGAHPIAYALAILIPARNEESNIGACLDSVCAQGSAIAEILVYDDHSTDATANIVRQHAASDARIRLLDPLPLPPGWCGKNFACAQLASRAGAEWMLFLDADARLREGAADAMLAEARRRDLTLLSCWPGLELDSLWERVLMPMLNFAVFTLYPAPLALSRPDASLGLAHGACLLVNRAAYERVGGHASVRSEIFEDTRLAQLWRTKGERSLCLDGQEIVRVRMYSSLPEIWSGFQKNFYPAFQTPYAFAAFLALHGVIFLSPFLVLNWGAMGIVLGMRALLAARFRQPWWTVLTHPVGQIFLIGLGISSWWACYSGRGVQWKGRKYLEIRV